MGESQNDPPWWPEIEKRQVRGTLTPPPPRQTPIYIDIYPLFYTPLSNSSWLHSTALRYMRSVHLGAYMWCNGPNRVKKGSKWVP